MNSTKTYTDEQRAAVEEALAQVRREADAKGYGSYAEGILSKVARNFREPHPADEAAENFANRHGHSGYSARNGYTFSFTREAVEDAFRAGYDLAQAPAPAEHTAEAMV